jgi:hypothetical protein
MLALFGNLKKKLDGASKTKKPFSHLGSPMQVLCGGSKNFKSMSFPVFPKCISLIYLLVKLQVIHQNPTQMLLSDEILS